MISETKTPPTPGGRSLQLQLSSQGLGTWEKDRGTSPPLTWRDIIHRVFERPRAQRRELEICDVDIGKASLDLAGKCHGLGIPQRDEEVFLVWSASHGVAGGNRLK